MRRVKRAGLERGRAGRGGSRPLQDRAAAASSRALQRAAPKRARTAEGGSWEAALPLQRMESPKETVQKRARLAERQQEEAAEPERFLQQRAPIPQVGRSGLKRTCCEIIGARGKLAAAAGLQGKHAVAQSWGY
jgi:hypothetical protein